MLKKFLDLIHVFVSGIGLKITLSYAPPILTTWAFFILYLRSLLETRPDAFWLNLAVGLGGIVVGSIVVVWLILSLVPQLRRIIEITLVLAKGDTSADIPYQKRKDEIGRLAQALHIFKSTAIEKAVLQKKQEEAKQMAEEQRRRASKELAEKFLATFRTIVSGLLGALTTQDKCVDSLETAVGSARQAVGVVAQLSQEAYGNVSAVAAASEELAASSREIGRQADQSRDVARNAVTGAQQTHRQAETLKEAAQRIGEVVTLIDSIAGQTNLLALNATIEAARAGEVGKGFAVVAGEVKSLANQTAHATKEITGYVQSIQTAIEAMASNVSGVAATIGQSHDISLSIASAVEQQIAATTEIARNVHTVVEKTATVEDSIGTLREVIGKVETTAGDAADAAQRSQAECATMQTEVTKFVAAG
ncbi:MAG: methyl-accepting chemotaxis protein [Alphaproteobacteria bacterium]